MPLRTVALVLHRYLGLTIATFLMVAGVTGTVLVFQRELEAAVNPHLVRVARPAVGPALLPPEDLHRRIQVHLPAEQGFEIPLHAAPGSSITVWSRVTDGTAAWGGGERWREWFFDPATGALLGSRVWGDLGEGRVNLLPFVYRLHYQLALGDVGMLLMGLVALAWTLDCFIGLYLTFPARRQQPVAQDRRSWWARWKPSWLVQGGSLFAGLFSFHRAVGLWVWPLLLVLAWSSVGFNLSPVFRPVMDVLGTAPDPWSDHPELTPPRVVPALPLAAALLRGETLLAERTIARGGAVVRPQSLSYDPESGLYEYRALTTLDLAQDYGRTRVWFDGDQGAFQGFYAPTGLAPGDTAESWLFALHMGRVGGWPYRLLLAVTGLMVAGLCVTGVMLWWRKRRIRRAHRNPASSAFSSPAPSTP